MSLRFLFLLLAGLIARPLAAQQFTASGTVTYEVFGPGEGRSEYAFEFSFDQGRYFIGLTPTVPSHPAIRFGFVDGSLYRIQQVFNRSTGAANDFAGNIETREWPDDDGTGADVLWLALGSFKSMTALAASTKRIFPPLWPLDDDHLVKEGFQMPVRASFLPGGLPRQIAFLNDGTNRYVDVEGVRHVERRTGRFADGYTNVLYEVGATRTYQGLTFPGEATMTRYYTIRDDTLPVRSIYTVRVKQVGPLAIQTFLPVFSGRAFTVDGRYKIVTGGRSNSLHYSHTNGFWPQGNELNRLYYKQMRQYGELP